MHPNKASNMKNLFKGEYSPRDFIQMVVEAKPTCTIEEIRKCLEAFTYRFFTLSGNLSGEQNHDISYISDEVLISYKIQFSKDLE